MAAQLIFSFACALMGICHVLNTKLFSSTINIGHIDKQDIPHYRRRIGVVFILFSVLFATMAIIEYRQLLDFIPFTFIYIFAVAVLIGLALYFKKKFSRRFPKDC